MTVAEFVKIQSLGMRAMEPWEESKSLREDIIVSSQVALLVVECECRLSDHACGPS